MAVRFRLFRFPVEVQPGFWLLALLIGLRPGRPWTEAAFWFFVIFVSVLVHELGHALVARRYGQEPVISLHMLGGVTSWAMRGDVGRGRRILITLAGPFAGFLLAAAAYGGALALGAAASASGRALAEDSPVLKGLGTFAVANVFWSVINLLPVLPFDGGQVLATALGAARRKLAASISLGFGLVVAIAMFRMGWLLGAVLFAMGGVSNFIAAFQREPARALPEGAAQELLRRARGALDAGEHEQAAAFSRAVLETSDAAELRKQAIELLGWAALLAGDVAAARSVLRGAGAPLDPHLEAAVAEADGDPEHAVRLLVAARASGDARPELAAMLVRLLLATGRQGEAAVLAQSIAEATSDEDLRRVAEEALGGGASAEAARLRMTLFERTRDPNDAFEGARGFARAQQRDAALDALRQAVGAGWADRDRARSEGDFSALWGDVGFEAALAGEGAGGGA